MNVTRPSPSDAKRALRSEMIALRARLAPQERADRSRAIALRLEALPAFRDARTVALYAPLGTEVDPVPATLHALERGVRVLFPRSVPGSRLLAFARWGPAELVRGPHGAAEPPEGAPALDPQEIDCVVMPGVAFSEGGVRLGRGGGHYDATLAAMPRAARVALAFDLQVLPSVPGEPHDAALDAIVTETRTLLFLRERR